MPSPLAIASILASATSESYARFWRETPAAATTPIAATAQRRVTFFFMVIVFRFDFSLQDKENKNSTFCQVF